MNHPPLLCSPAEYLRGSGLNELDSAKFMEKELIGKQEKYAKLFKEISDIQNEIREARQSAQEYLRAADVLESAMASNAITKIEKIPDELLIKIYLECKSEWKSTNKKERKRIAVMFGNAVIAKSQAALNAAKSGGV